MSVRKISETPTTVTIGWDAMQGQEGYVPTLDGSELLADGKRHAGTSKTQTQVKMAKPADGDQPHSYGVNILGVIAAGAVTVPEPTPPPPVTGGPWAWDARNAILMSDSAAQIADFLAHGIGNGHSFSCDVAVCDVGRPGDPAAVAYAVTGGKAGNYDSSVRAPAGVRAGASSDHHLVLRDHAQNREHDFWEAAPSGSAIGSGGGGSFALDAVQEPIGKWSNAGRFPLQRTAITAEEVKAGRITHALEFSAVASWIGGPSVYPADGTSGGPGHGMPFGRWLRIDPTLDISNLTGLDWLITDALQRFGMFLRDGGSELDMSGVDYINQGGNAAVWGDAGVTLTVKTGSGYPWARSIGAVPWSHLQALQPPTP